MNCRNLLLLLLLLSSTYCVAQTAKSKLGLKLMFGLQELELDRNYYLENWGDSLKFEKIQFYISKVEIYSDSGWNSVDDAQYRLVDMEDPESMSFDIKQNTVIHQLRFNLGIDSVTNVSGAFGGDLDPTKGMYWSWQSGYINVKLEGVSKKFQTRNNAFQYHLGGYDGAFNSCQSITLFVKDEVDPVVSVNLKQFFKQLDSKHLSSVMSPSLEAVHLSYSLANSFKLLKE